MRQHADIPGIGRIVGCRRHRAGAGVGGRPVAERQHQEASDGRDGEDHLVRLPGEQFAVWTWASVRGAGFPIADLLQLGSEDAAAAADRALTAQEALAAAREAGLAALVEGFDRCPPQLQPQWQAAGRQLARGRLPALPQAETADFAAAFQAAAAAGDAHLLAYAAARRRQSEVLRRAAGEPRLREAVTWQNRHALATAFDPLLRQAAAGDGSGDGDGAGANKQTRRHEQLVASYLHRYCTKNDTIGFFGPVGWARVTDAPVAIVARPGARLVSHRRVFFETWCIDAVAEALARDRPLRPWLTPRQLPFFVLQGNLYIPFAGTPSQLSPAERAVFAACRGRQTALELAARLTGDPAAAAAGSDGDGKLDPVLGLASAADVFEVLESLAARGMIVWQMEVPMHLAGEEELARIVRRVADPALREPMLAEIGELVAARDAVAAAAGDADRLLAALEALDGRFQQCTGGAARRLPGQTYAGRTLVHEDCRRDLDVEIGADFLAALGPPLSLVLMGARWLCEETARRFRGEFQRAYGELCAASGATAIGLLQFLQKVAPVLLAPGSSLVAAVAAEHERRWSEILALPAGERRVQLAGERIQPLVAEAFRASGPGWRLARHHSPDLLVRAASVEAIGRGDFQVVLGEVHLATNTLRNAVLIAHHPQPQDLWRAMLRDIPDPTVIPWLPRRRDGQPRKNPLGFHVIPRSARLELGLIGAKDLRLALDTDPPGDPHATTLFLGDCLVTERGGALSVVTRDGSQCMDVVDFCELAISVHTINSFRLLSGRPHTPRIAIDKLIVQRELWRVPLADIPVAAARPGADRFLAARAFVRRHRLPRFVFVGSPYEKKPFCVDFASPAAIEIFARACRGAQEKGGPDVQIAISEMLPEPEQTWLPGPHGERYTSELRLVAVDRAGRSGATAGST